jgi:GH43 family beta-xylosidase
VSSSAPVKKLETNYFRWVFRHDGHYYMTYTNNDNITLYRNDVLTDWNNAESKLIFKPEPGFNYSTDLWAPEVHNINGNWYVFRSLQRLA